jgi:hypothetical protein
MTNRTPTLECIDPGRVEEADIPAYAAGEGRPEFIEHLKDCLFCNTEVADYKSINAWLDAGLSRRPASRRAACLDIQLIADYAMDLLKPAEKKQVKEHLKACDFCTAEYKLFQADLAESVMPVEPVPGLLETATGFLRRVTAALVPATPAVGLRGATSGSGSHPKEYEVEDVSVVVLLEPGKSKKSGLTLSGTIQRENSPVAPPEVRLLQDGQIIRSEQLDETGSFLFENLTGPSSFSLEIQFSDKIVVVPEI